MLGAIIGGIGKIAGAALPFLGKALGGASAGAASFAGDRYMLEKKHQFSKREAEKDRAYQTAERIAAHDYGTTERIAQQTFSAKQAAKQMDFQKHMPSTQTPRAAADMKRAGLNRILALGQPAAAPAGAMATAGQPSSHKGSGSRASASSAGEGSAAVRNAIGLAQAVQTIKVQKEQADLLDAQAFKARAEGRAASASADRGESINIPFSILMDMLGRGGDAARNIRDYGGKIWDRIQDDRSKLKDTGVGWYKDSEGVWRKR